LYKYSAFSDNFETTSVLCQHQNTVLYEIKIVRICLVRRYVHHPLLDRPDVTNRMRSLGLGR